MELFRVALQLWPDVSVRLQDLEKYLAGTHQPTTVCNALAVLHLIADTYPQQLLGVAAPTPQSPHSALPNRG